MLNKFCKMPLWECNRTLIRVAQGQEPAELVIRHARLISVTTHEILEDTDIAIACGRVAYVGIAPYTAEHCIGEKTRVIDAQGSLVAPGFMDGHIHVESSMVGVDEYARAVTPTTSRDRPDSGVLARPWARICSAMPGISTSTMERTTSGA